MADIHLIIFDCDGVLVDSEPIADRVFGEMLAELGLQLTEEEMFDAFMGYSLQHCVQVAERLLGRPLPEGFVRVLQDRTFAAFRTGLKAMAGIEHALNQVGVPYCVASNGDHEKMRTTLGITGLLPRFEDRMFSVTQVAHGKPAPDLYLFAAGQLHADPARCVVVEDSPPGVTGGVAAGMTVLGFCAHTPVAKLVHAGAHTVFDDMFKLPELLRSVSVGGST